MLNKVSIDLPASPEAIAKLELGSIVYLNGLVYTAREGVYDRILNGHDELPEGLTEASNVNFHCSPAAAAQDDGGYHIGGVTATASFRFSKYLERWLDLTQTKILIGKGGLPEKDYKEILAPRGVVYLTTVGYGTGALLGRGVQDVEAVHWLDELGIAQAMWLFKVKDFGPFLVDSDLEGNSLFAQQGALVNKNIESLYDGLKEPALHRYGETRDRKDELM
jgi:L(+)-tartrate dehydratase beta subunit